MMTTLDKHKDISFVLSIIRDDVQGDSDHLDSKITNTGLNKYNVHQGLLTSGFK
jgi:hypothetical protein